MNKLKEKVLLAGAAALVLLTACAANPAPAVTAEPSPVQIESAEPAAAVRTVSCTMLREGEEINVYPEVSEDEIALWDSASGGQIVAVARYAQAMPGAAEAAVTYDFTDLDGDGSSELTASFSFSDGTTASLTWFYVDGGYVYNEEFSTLPGDVSAKGED